MPGSTITTTLTHGVSVGSAAYASPLTITSTGAINPTTIASGETAAVYGNGVVINDGTILGGNSMSSASLIGISLFGGVTNNGLIRGGIYIGSYGSITNFGTISGFATNGSGVSIDAGGTGETITNFGTIIGGVEMYSGTVINAGTIDGNGGYAIHSVTDFQGFKLVVEPGAVFIGDVTPGSEEQPNVILELAGTSTTALSGIGTSFQNFNKLSFSTDAAWTAEGSLGGLEIDGFTFNDTLVLDSFAATSDTYVAGTGLELSNSANTETLNIMGSFAADSFAVTTAAGDTIIQLDTFSQSQTHTINTTLTSAVTLGVTYPGPVLITNTGAVEPTASAATAITGKGDLENDGVIRGGSGGFAGTGIYLSGGIITNSGTILGGTGSYAGEGVELTNTTFDNSGRVEGAFISASTLRNSGIIAGGSSSYGGDANYVGALTLSFTGAVYKNPIGSNGTNAGTIEGNDAGTTLSGFGVRDFISTFTNDTAGTIDGLIGVVLKNATFANHGAVSGNNGVYVGFDSTLINSGTINGFGGSPVYSHYYSFSSADAVVFASLGDTTSSELIVDPGAVFDGKVVAHAGAGDVLQVAGTSATELTGIGTQFLNFGTISFAAAAAWTIAGDAAGLATGETITGFTSNDALILDGFTTTSDSYVAGTGLELTNGATTETVDLAGGFSTASFIVLDQPGDTVIALKPDTIVSNTLTIGVTFGGGRYASPLTITSTGALEPGAGSGYVAGVYGTGTVINDGTIIGYAASPSGDAGGFGVDLYGTLENSGFIAGGSSNGIGDTGVKLRSGLLINSGTITGGFGAGYLSQAGAYLSDATASNSGLITGGFAGAAGSGGVVGVLLTASTLTNTGTINGGGNGAQDLGIYISGGATLINSGTIIGNGSAMRYDQGGAVYLGSNASFYTVPGTYPNKLIVEPGAVFIGNVAAEPYAGDVLEVAGSSAVALTGLGTSFTGFADISFASGAAWSIAGDATGLATGETITGFTSNDALILDGFTATSDSYVAGTGLVLSNGLTTATIDLFGGFSTSSFIITDSAVGTEVQLCYLRGTRVATPAGEIPVESLAIGDTVITRFNGYRRIKWIGRQSFSARFIKDNRDQIPVCIAAGALGPNLPRRDLSVSPGHSMLLGGVLVLARSLVNGITITQQDLPDEIHYYQLEFDTHDCVLAEGAWSESFCDYAGLRNQFHNVAEFHALYPNHLTPTEHRMCAPRPEHGPALAGALAPVVARAAACTTPGPLQGWIDEISPDGTITGWAQDSANPELPVLLEILLQGRALGTILACDHRPDLATAGIAQGRAAFTFTAPARLPPQARGTLTVRRAADLAALPMAPHCLAHLQTKRRKRA